MRMKANTLRMIEKKDRPGSSMALLSRCIRPGLDYVCTSDLHLDYVYERQVKLSLSKLP